MKSKPTLLAILLLAVTGTVSAHHGAAAYDMAQQVTVKGVVTECRFINPHVLIFMDAKDASGNVTKWQGELTSPNRLSREGWTKNTVKAGDEITVTGGPSKSGAHSMWILKISNAIGELKIGGVD
jgi:hypothetical protein